MTYTEAMTRSNDVALRWMRTEAQRECADTRARLVLGVILLQISPLLLWWLI